MKFEELLDKARGVTPGLDWLDYHSLKGLLPAPPETLPEQLSADKQILAIAANASSVDFFLLLMCELRKVEKFYLDAETELAQRYEQLIPLLQAVCLRCTEVEGGDIPFELYSEVKMLINRYMDLNTSLIHLENYAVLCYAGVGKILKKHDKLTGANERARGRVLRALAQELN
jgi:SPX domain protein involved in polyphosphate accumulation